MATEPDYSEPQPTVITVKRRPHQKIPKDKYEAVGKKVVRFTVTPLNPYRGRPRKEKGRPVRVTVLVDSLCPECKDKALHARQIRSAAKGAAQAKEIAELTIQGWSRRQIAVKMGLGKSMIWKVTKALGLNGNFPRGVRPKIHPAPKRKKKPHGLRKPDHLLSRPRPKPKPLPPPPPPPEPPKPPPPDTHPLRMG